MPQILWLSCGGTIACPPDKSNLSPRASEEQMHDMLKKIPLPENTNITPRCVMNIDSSDMGVKQLRTLTAAVHSSVNEGFSGIVITHGTDTMAYTAAALFFALENLPPVIITGAQLPFYEKASDGPANLSNALKAACDRRFSGVYLLFGDKIISGDRAVKVHTTDNNAFISAAGYAAIIQSGEFTEVTVKGPDICGNCTLHRIAKNTALIKLTPFTDSYTLYSLSKNNIKGLVIEGYGCCGIPGRLLDAIKKISDKGVKVVFVSQCLYGQTNGERYEVGVNAAKSGVIYGFAPTAEAALAKLSVTAADYNI